MENPIIHTIWFAYLFISLPLGSYATLFASIASSLGQEVILPTAARLSTTNHDFTCRKMKDRDAASVDEPVSGKLSDYRLEFAWFVTGGRHYQQVRQG
jgi:hypothetical protein